MSVSEYVIQKLYDEDKDYILGARIDKVLKINNKNIAFIIYNKGQSKTLLFSLDPNLPIYLLGQSLVSFVEETNGFCVMLKKYLEYGVINSFEKVENDRIIKLKIRKKLPTYVYQTTTLVFEMIPMRANMLLLDNEDKIIDAFHKSEGFEGNNAIIKGLKYVTKKIESKKINLDDSLEDIRYKVSRKEYNYLSSLDAEMFLKAKKQLMDGQSFYLLENDISLIPLENGIELKKDDLLEALLKKREKEARKNHFHVIIDFVEKKCNSLNKKINKLKMDLKSCEDYEIYKDYGNLLFYGSSTYQKGDKQVEIEGVVIPLKEDKDLSANAKDYFKKYKKSRSGIIQIKEQINLAEKELSYFAELKSQIEYASEEDYKQIIYQLENDHYLNIQHKTVKKKKEEKVFNPHILVYKGIKIGYGLSSFQNDYLTFTLAHKEDVFLHVKDYHGPHVIIFDENPSDDVLLFAAEVSLYFASKSAGEVYYAKRKNIKKIPAKTGMVELNEYKEIHLTSIREETIKIIKDHK